MFNLNEYLEQHRSYREGTDTMLELRPRIKCADGLEFSAQASELHYATPKENTGPYSEVEVGYPNQAVPEWLPYAEGQGYKRGCSTVYPYIPVELVEKTVNERGGLAQDAEDVSDG